MKDLDRISRLSQEIEEFYEGNKQSSTCLKMKMKLLTELEKAIGTIVPNVRLKLYPYGSTVNGCGDEGSDLDLYMQAVTPQQKSHFANGLPSFLRIIEHGIRKHFGEDCEEIETIDAKVPIVTFTLGDRYDGQEVDINGSAKDGVHQAYLFRQYARIDQCFPQLCLLIKEWAKKNEICGTSDGFLNSLSYQILVVHYLQSIKPSILPNLQQVRPGEFRAHCNLEEHNFGNPYEKTQTTNLFFKELLLAAKNDMKIGELLIGFFKYYANFSWKDLKVSIDEGLLIRGKWNKDHMFIESTHDKPNVAKSLRDDQKFKMTLFAFDKALEILSRNDSNLEKFMEKISFPSQFNSLYKNRIKKGSPNQSLQSKSKLALIAQLKALTI